MNFKDVLCVVVSVVGFAASHSAFSDDDFWLNEGPILLQNITVIDGLGHDAKPMRDILVQDGKIARVSVTTMMPTLPDGTRIIDGKGLTVLPGLIDNHTHLMDIDYTRSTKTGDELAAMNGDDLFGNAFNYAIATDNLDGMQLYLNADLYSGITTVLEVGGILDVSAQLRDEITAGTRIGPTIHTSGAFIDALQSTPNGTSSLVTVETLAEIREIFDSRAAKGASHLKIYGGVTAWEARHLSAEAKRRGFKIIADLWGSNLSRDFMEIGGNDAYAHGGMLEVTPDDAAWMAANDKFVTMTLIIFDNQRGLRAYEDYEKRSFLQNPLVVDVYGKKAVEQYYDAYLSLQEQWNDGDNAMYTIQHWGDKMGNLEFNMQNLRVLHDAGVVLGIGTDAAYPPGSWPGEALHHELELTVKAGIKPVEALKMATYNNAWYIGVEDEVGSIESGKIADLLIVEGNPAENISDTRNIRYVIKNGKIVNRNVLKFR